jgi:hypothetical protein
MAYQLYLAVAWNPIGMHVEQTHENTYHQSAVVEVFVLFNLLDDYYLSICRSDNQSFCVRFLVMPDGATEEINYYEIYYCGYSEENITYHGTA